ncbi:hypothetical protein ABNF97_26540 [Plantactinospora sp. B6F1]|uniref:hypothetical protein n=1 Tax=Plantactinospora sp. B6F1 TaxID=3158971 RepID=UPI0010CFEDBF
MSLTRPEAELAAAGSAARPPAGPDEPGDEPTDPAPLPAVPGLVMLTADEDAPVCADGTCR